MCTTRKRGKTDFWKTEMGKNDIFSVEGTMGFDWKKNLQRLIQVTVDQFSYSSRCHSLSCISIPFLLMFCCHTSSSTRYTQNHKTFPTSSTPIQGKPTLIPVFLTFKFDFPLLIIYMMRFSSPFSVYINYAILLWVVVCKRTERIYR